jgi:uncharacterized protein (TIGR02270 family)
MSAQVQPLAHLIDESFEEAAFLWSRWEADLASISRNLDEVWTWTEDRLSGALDGVRLAPDAALERLAEMAVSGGKPLELTVCGHVLANAAAPGARALLARTLSAATGTHLRALMRGIEVAALNGSFAPITKLLSRHSPEHAAALAGLKAFRRAALSDELQRAFESNITELQVQALRAARQLPQQYVAAWVDTGLKAEDPAVRLAAMETGVRHRIPNAWREALSALRDKRSACASLVPLVAMLGQESEHQLIFSLLGEPALQRAALWSLGSIGTMEAGKYCIAALKHPKLSRMAAEAYCAITGADLARDRMSMPEPDEPTPTFEADNLDANLVPTPEQQWPLPNPDALRKHWNEQQARFRSGMRYVRGQPTSPEVLMRSMETAPMLRRPDYAFELYVRTEGKYDVEPRTTRAIQRSMMNLGRTRVAEPAAA